MADLNNSSGFIHFLGGRGVYNSPQLRGWARTLLPLIALGVVAPVTAWSEPLTPPPTDGELIHQALHRCRSVSKARREAIDSGLLQKLLDLERAHGVPEAYRGLTLAKACIESGFSANSRGDCKDGHCRAVGMVQLWPWTERFGVNRRDPVASVRFLLKRTAIGMRGGRMEKICGQQAQGDLDAFRVAWLRINRGPLQGGRPRCLGMPKDLTRLQLWHQMVARDRAARAATDAAAGAPASLAPTTATLAATQSPAVETPKSSAQPGGAAEARAPTGP